MSATFRTSNPVQIVSVTRNKNISDKVLIDVVTTSTDRNGYTNHLAFGVWNPSADLKPVLQKGNWIVLEGRVQARQSNERYFTDLAAFNSTILQVEPQSASSEEDLADAFA